MTAPTLSPSDPVVGAAARIVGAIHDGTSNHALADMLRGQHLGKLIVTLARMVDPDKTVRELCGHVEEPPMPARPPRHPWLENRRPIADLQPCGTHAAYVRHKQHDENPDEECIIGERAYQRERKRRWREARYDRLLAESQAT